jgi:PST family polysaccharide transporter
MTGLDTSKIVNATKWSAITEIVAKLIAPVTNMVLARLLAPDAFGVVATITMIVSFAEIFTDAGFQKYLIQHEFKDTEEREQNTNVAFWSNLTLSLLLWLVIGLFSEPLARVVGNPGLGNIITIACISIPLAAFSSIQMALYKRDFDFKTLFKARLAGISTPLLVTIPLALWLRSYWALVIGTIAVNLVNAILLSAYSKWKPKFYYSWARLKEMLSFTVWSMIEAISIWLTSYIDIFIIGIYLNEYYLGIYKTSMTVVGQITALVTAATTPILFSSLSRLQADREGFKTLFFKFQKLVGLLIIPLGVGIYCFRHLVTDILLGSQWAEAADFIGLWGLTSAITIVLAHYSSEIYRSLGKPKLSVLAQFLHIIVLCPAMLIAVKYDWTVIYTTRALIRLELVAVNLVIMYCLVRISPYQMIKNITPSIIASCIMGAAGLTLLMFSSTIWWAVVSAIVCTIIYSFVIMLFKNERRTVISFVQKLVKKER